MNERMRAELSRLRGPRGRCTDGGCDWILDTDLTDAATPHYVETCWQCDDRRTRSWEAVFVYALVDPVGEEVRYVGKTNNPRARLRQHVRNATIHAERPLPVESWILSLLERSLRPTLRVLEQSWIHHVLEREHSHIQAHLARGCRLTNVRYGDQYERVQRQGAA